MANNNKPWFPFDAMAWVGDPILRLCTLESKGLLIELMALAHHGTPVGYVNHSGRPLSVAEIARLVGEEATKVTICMDELVSKARVIESAKGYYIKRMVKDAGTLEKCVEAGRKGGEPKPSKNITVDSFVDALGKDTPDIREAFAEWIEYRNKRKLPSTPQSVKRQASVLLSLQADEVPVWVHCAIDRGWRSFFCPPTSYKARPQSSRYQQPVLSQAEMSEVAGQMKRALKVSFDDFTRCVSACCDKYKGQDAQIRQIARAVEGGK